MPEHGGDAGHCFNGLSAKNFRAASFQERALYRKWIVGMAIFYGTLLLIFGGVAIVGGSIVGLTRLTTLSAHPTVVSARKN